MKSLKTGQNILYNIRKTGQNILKSIVKTGQNDIQYTWRYEFMFRKESITIKEWIESSDKALLVTGARQIGKTWLIRDEIDKSGCKHSKDKKATSYAEITGSWLHEVVIDNEVFWRREDYQLFQIYEMEFKLPSDSTLRKDLKLFIEGKEEEAQVEKEKMEEMQRRDRKLRGGEYKK